MFQRNSRNISGGTDILREVERRALSGPRLGPDANRMNAETDVKGSRLLTAAAYTALFLAGAVEGLIGSFQYSRLVPVAAIGFCVLLLATCLLGSWAMRSVSGAVSPAVGWIVASFVLSMPVSSGSVIITNSAAGKWYLYGGTVSALAGIALSFGALSFGAQSFGGQSFGGRVRGGGARPR